MSAGKGDTPRPVNWQKYGSNYDDIFRRRTPKCPKCDEQMENNYVFGWECENCDNGKDHYHDR